MREMKNDILGSSVLTSQDRRTPLTAGFYEEEFFAFNLEVIINYFKKVGPSPLTHSTNMKGVRSILPFLWRMQKHLVFDNLRNYSNYIGKNVQLMHKWLCPS